MLGSWDVDVQVGKLPQKVATYFSGELGKLLGAMYRPVAYLGFQVVNGTNHAVLCEQVITTGEDTTNAVVVKVNEKDEGICLVGVEPVLESGGPLGGTAVCIKTDIPSEAKAVFDDAFSRFVGSRIQPFALLGTQEAHGKNYIFAALTSAITGTSGGVLGGGDYAVQAITINDQTHHVSFAPILR